MSKTRSKYPFSELSRLKGKMTEHHITYEELAKALGKSTSGVCKILNGEVDAKLSIQRRIKNYVNKKAERLYTLDELFG
jgi:predicted transcriptional regulator